MVFIDGDICEYYAWFIKKRFNLILNPPLRNAHISFINDSIRDFNKKSTRTQEEIDKNWEDVKNKWDGKEIELTLSVDTRTDGNSWWLNIPNENRDSLQAIRNELGLDRPYYGMHLSLGYARPGVNKEHSEYIHGLIQKGFI